MTDTNSYNLTWGRISFLLSLKKSIITTTHTETYVGGGGDFHLIAPVVSQQYLEDTLESAYIPFSPHSDLGLEHRFGPHVLLGVHVSPFPTGIRFTMEGKYSWIPPGKYEEPHNLFSLYGGILYSFKYRSEEEIILDK